MLTADVAAVADALGIGRFAVLGHSGGGPHALACTALLPERVIAAVSVSASAPLGAVWIVELAGFCELLSDFAELDVQPLPWYARPPGRAPRPGRR